MSPSTAIACALLGGHSSSAQLPKRRMVEKIGPGAFLFRLWMSPHAPNDGEAFGLNDSFNLESHPAQWLIESTTVDPHPEDGTVDTRK